MRKIFVTDKLRHDSIPARTRVRTWDPSDDEIADYRLDTHRICFTPRAEALLPALSAHFPVRAPVSSPFETPYAAGDVVLVCTLNDNTVTHVTAHALEAL